MTVDNVFETDTPYSHLKRYIRVFDRALESGYLDKRSSRDVQLILAQLQDFYDLVFALLPDVEKNDALRKTLAIGCRLAADLSYRLQDWGHASFDQSNEELQALYRLIGNHLSRRRQGERVLHQSQELLQKTEQVGRAIGLGMII